MEDIAGSTMICTGSDAYNAATGYFTRREMTWLNLDASSPQPRDWCVRILKGSRKGQSEPVFELREAGVVAEVDLAVLERINDQEHDNTVFLAHGYGVNGTRGAIRYLVENWHELLDRYGTEEFALCLRFLTSVEDPEGFLQEPRVLLKLPN